MIITVYNTANYLHQCLDSIISQTLKDIEIICVNDGSTDTSLEILNEFAAVDERIIIITQDNQGPGIARNTGLKLAKGIYFSFLDSDDFFEPEMLSEMYNLAENESCEIVVCRYKQLNCDTNEIHIIYDSPAELLGNYKLSRPFSFNDVPDFYFQGFTFYAWNKLYKADLIKKNLIVFPKLFGPEDCVFVAKALAMADRIGTVNNTLLTYRKNRLESVSHNRKKAPLDFFEAMREIKLFLLENNIFQKYEKTFINFSVQHCLWVIQNFSNYVKITNDDAAIFTNIYNYFRNVFIKEMEFTKYPIGYFFNSKYFIDLNFIDNRDIVHYLISEHERQILNTSFNQEKKELLPNNNDESANDEITFDEPVCDEIALNESANDELFHENPIKKEIKKKSFKDLIKKIIKSILKIFIPANLRKQLREILSLYSKSEQQFNAVNHAVNQQFNAVNQRLNEMNLQNKSLFHEINTFLLIKEQSPGLLNEFALGLKDNKKLITALSNSYIFNDVKENFKKNAWEFIKYLIGSACLPLDIIYENLYAMAKNPIIKPLAFFGLVKMSMANYQNSENSLTLDEMYDISFINEDYSWAKITLYYINYLLARKEEKKALFLLKEYVKNYSIECITEYLPAADLAHRNGMSNDNISSAAKLYQTIIRNIRYNSLENYINNYGPNASIAIVGNGPHEIGLDRGKEIDAHDIVVRFNYYNNTDKYKKDYGSKTNIVFFAPSLIECCNLFDRKIDMFVSHSIFSEYFSSDTIKKHKDLSFSNITSIDYSQVMFEAQKKYCITWPSVGFRGVYYFKNILKRDNIDIYGMAISSRKIVGGHYENTGLGIKNEFHNLDAEYIAMQDMFGIKPIKNGL